MNLGGGHVRLGLPFGKKKCVCEERRYSRRRLLCIASRYPAKRHATVSVDFCVPQKTLVMAEGYGISRGDAHMKSL